jgi:hypothetical protein
MATGYDDDDDFGLDDVDDLELQALAENAEQQTRKRSRDESATTGQPPRKILKTTDTHVDTVALGVAINVLNNRFKLPGFRLKQSLAISRILSGESSIVVFPTGETRSEAVYFRRRHPLMITQVEGNRCATKSLVWLSSFSTKSMAFGRVAPKVESRWWSHLCSP